MSSDFSLHPSMQQPGGEVPSPPPQIGRSKSLPGIARCTHEDASFSPTAAKIDKVEREALAAKPEVVEQHPHKIDKASETKGETANTVFENTITPSFKKAKSEPNVKTMRGQDIARNREMKFIQIAGSYGVNLQGAKYLYETSGAGTKDLLTGFDVIQDMQPTKEAAIASGKSVLQVDVDIENLGKLNAARGSSDADDIIKVISKTVKDNLSATGVKMASFRDGGKFSFIIEVGSEQDKKNLESALKDTAKQVKKSSKVELDITISPLKATPDTASTSHSPEAPQQDTLAKVPWSSSQIRHNLFVRIAKGSNVSTEIAEELFTFSRGGEKDSLTGLDRAIDRLPTLINAQGEVKASGASGVYIGIDIRNLKGINKAKKSDQPDEVKARAEADKEYAHMVSIVKDELKALGMQVAGFRHGGDEMSFIIIGKKDMPQQELNRVCNDALKGAQKKIEGELAHLADIPHAKYADQKGSGISFGLCPITDKYNPETIIKIADERVENSKVGSKKPLGFAA